eukprot:445228-Pyramimonas_sp.AAC.1
MVNGAAWRVSRAAATASTVDSRPARPPWTQRTEATHRRRLLGAAAAATRRRMRDDGAPPWATTAVRKPASAIMTGGAGARRRGTPAARAPRAALGPPRPQRPPTLRTRR